MSESFGARLRQQREARQVSLAAIADDTKIKLSLFEQLERDDLSHWPSGIFRRAYIRAYAHTIGLDPDVVLHEFLQAHPDPVERVEAVAAVAAATERVNATAPTRLRTIVDAAIGSLARRQRGSASETHTPLPPPSNVHVPLPPTPAPQPADVRGTCGKNEEPVLAPVAPPAPVDPDLTAVAQLCTRLGCVATGDELPELLHEAATLLDATGLVVWLWDPAVGELSPVVAHGYSEKILAQLPGVRPDADNATAAAFRLGRTCSISGRSDTNGALVVPLLAAAGCSGVLALELEHRAEQSESIRAIASIVATLLAQLVAGAATEVAAPPRAVGQLL